MASSAAVTGKQTSSSGQGIVTPDCDPFGILEITGHFEPQAASMTPAQLALRVTVGDPGQIAGAAARAPAPAEPPQEDAVFDGWGGVSGNLVVVQDLQASPILDPGASAASASLAMPQVTAAAAASLSSPLPLTTPRVVVMTDIHGNDVQFDIMLNQSHAKDGNTTIVIMGDCNDKGSETLKVFDRLDALFIKNQNHPERCVYLCGNHELCILLGDFHLVKNYNRPLSIDYDPV
ncbi:MAG: metallophosphoesterase, partial [Chlamydiae bacterium]|nr:metallophosphoesterase [Chlamydiota bacterium]